MKTRITLLSFALLASAGCVSTALDPNASPWLFHNHRWTEWAPVAGAFATQARHCPTCGTHQRQTTLPNPQNAKLTGAQRPV